MSWPFLKGTLKHLAKAQVTFARYHIKSHLSKAVDEVCREEAQHQEALLRNTRYMWLKRPAKLTERQRDLLDELLAQPLETVRAYTLAQQFDSFYELEDPDTAEEYLRRWITEVARSGLVALQKFARTLEDHWLAVIRWHHSRISNGLLEGLNSLSGLSPSLPRRDSGVRDHSDSRPLRGPEIQPHGLGPAAARSRVQLAIAATCRSRGRNDEGERRRYPSSLIQAAKRRARGYRTNRNFIAMIYLIVAKLNTGPVIA